MQLPSYKKNSSKLIELNLYITRNDQISSKSPNKKFRDLHTCRISTKLLLLTEVWRIITNVRKLPLIKVTLTSHVFFHKTDPRKTFEPKQTRRSRGAFITVDLLDLLDFTGRRAQLAHYTVLQSIELPGISPVIDLPKRSANRRSRERDPLSLSTLAHLLRRWWRKRGLYGEFI